MTKEQWIDELAKRDQRGEPYSDDQRVARWMLAATPYKRRVESGRILARVVALLIVWVGAVVEVKGSGHGIDGFTILILGGGGGVSYWITRRT